MPTRIDWLPYSIIERAAFLRVFATHIDDVAPALGLTPAEVTRIHEIADAYNFAVNITELAKANAKTMVAWRNHVISGERSAKALGPRPQFDNSPPPAGTSQSLIYEIRRIVNRIKQSPGYSPTMGIRLGILTPNHVKTPQRELKPTIKATAVHGFKVRVACEMKGMDAIQVEYRRNGDEKWQKVAFLTRLPATFYIEPAVMGVPETGVIRCYFLKKNDVVGQPSNMQPVTLFAA